MSQVRDGIDVLIDQLDQTTRELVETTGSSDAERVGAWSAACPAGRDPQARATGRPGCDQPLRPA